MYCRDIAPATIYRSRRKISRDTQSATTRRNYRSIRQHYGRNGEQAGGEFEIVEIFAAKVLGEARI